MAPQCGYTMLRPIMMKPDRPSDSSSIRTIGILIAVIAVLYLAREIFIPLAFAMTLTLILAPAVAWLQKIHLGRVPSVFLVMAVSIAVAGGIADGVRGRVHHGRELGEQIAVGGGQIAAAGSGP